MSDKIPNRQNWCFEDSYTTNKGILNKRFLIDLFMKNMFVITSRMFKYTGLPETIKEKDLEFQLQMNGFSVVTKANDGNLYAFYGGLGGLPNAYYLPTKCVVANPYLKFNKEIIIENDKDGVLCLNDNLYRGLRPTNLTYATLLAENYISLQVALINARIPAIISVNGDEEYTSALNYLESIYQGEIGVISTNELISGIDTKPFANGDLRFNQYTETIQFLKASWFNDFGLNLNYNMKREYLNQAETSYNLDSSVPTIDEMENMRKDFVERINKKYGTNITVERDSAWKVIKEKSELSSDLMSAEVKQMESQSEEVNNEQSETNNTQDSINDKEDNKSDN